LFPSEKAQAARRAALIAHDGTAAAARLGAALDNAGFDRAPFEGFLAQLRGDGKPITLADAKPHGLDFLLGILLHDDANDMHTVATYVYPAPGRELDTARALAATARVVDGIVTGTPVLERILKRIITDDTWILSAASAIVVFLLLALHYRRARTFIVIALPLIVAWCLFAGALGATGIPLNLFNLLAVPLVLGYGIDDLLFLLHRHDDDGLAPSEVTATTGRAVVLTSLATMAGFGGLLVARFGGLRLLGLSGVLAVAVCMIAAFAVLPALLSVLTRK
jgi:predicted RND superfamily exporter protein